MKKRFVVAVNSTNVEGDRAFLDAIKNEGCGYWHWLSNLWLISDPKGQLSASVLRDKLKTTHPKVRSLVLELGEDEDTWAGFGKTGENGMFEWIKRNWHK